MDEVRKQVEQLYEEAEAPTEEYLGIRERQKKLEKAAGEARDRIARQQDEINELRDQIGPFAAAQYRSGGIDSSLQLALSADPDDYLEQASLLDRVGDRQAAAMRALQGKQRRLTQDREEATAQLRAVEEARTKAAAKKSQVTKKLAEARKLLAGLTAEERTRLAAAEEREDAASGAGDSAATYNGPASTVPGSPQALTAVDADRILVATATGDGSESGVYESRDGGKTFTQLTADAS